MTWVMENKNASPEKRVAVINLKVCSIAHINIKQGKANYNILHLFKLLSWLRYQYFICLGIYSVAFNLEKNIAFPLITYFVTSGKI